eukprot:CAMPEP_0175041040 /NCGR_PEP_ID=MMETSP0052_2-20121109/1665_1 /TAXON_ID=51329 ORGANISM="Polytomella parva, Strain SAG 63-3" /NCGR_SAMPLE_ID=MMETSP0052_2 /ASSEMBLY_ACC=CAM_ASM_000194 /LENGTH=46 /DNA_ID= /DNA_START= /DNA_END= /DNA_ORIENTATION=
MTEARTEAVSSAKSNRQPPGREQWKTAIEAINRAGFKGEKSVNGPA